MKRIVGLLVFTALLASGAAWGQQGRLTICVTEPEGDVAAPTQKQLGEDLRAAVEAYGQWQVLRGPALSARLLRLRARCTGTAPVCLAAMGRMARADRLLYTRLTAVGGQYRVEMLLVDVGRKLLLDSYVSDSPLPEDQLTGEWKRALAALLGPRSAGQLKVSSNVTGAEVLLDGEPIGRTPLVLTRELAPGEHRIAVRQEGYRPAEQVFRMDSPEGVTLHLLLEAAPEVEPAKMAGGKDDQEPSALAKEPPPAEAAPAPETAPPVAASPPRISTVRRPAPGEDLSRLMGGAVAQTERPAVEDQAKAPSPTSPFWKRWWFWTAVGVVAAGSAALGVTLGLSGGGSIPAGHGRVTIDF